MVPGLILIIKPQNVWVPVFESVNLIIGLVAKVSQLGNVVVLNLGENCNFVHQLFAAAPLDGFDGDVLNGFFLAAFVDDGILATAHFLLDVIVIHF